MDDELMPCPFCGSTCVDEYEGQYGNGVYCMSCGAMVGEQMHDMMRTSRVSREEAIKAWNTRNREDRTCTVKYFDDNDGEPYEGFIPYFYLSCGHEAEGEREPDFCPKCGARVVRE